MNIITRLFTRKLLTVPQTNETTQIEVVQLWTVRWVSRNGPYSGDLRQEVEAFTSEADATAFKQSLENAFQLLRHTSGTTVIIIKEQ